MAKTICLPDGTTEYVFTDEDVFIERLIRERLGDDAARFVTEYIRELVEEAKYTEEVQQEAEKIADGYSALCQGALGALGELKDLVRDERLNRAEIQKIVDGAYSNLYRNL